MEQKQTRLFHKTLSHLWKRIFVFSMLSLVAFVAAAQTNALRLTVDGTTTISACVDEPIVLSASATNPSVGNAVNVFRSYDGSHWTAIGTATKDNAGIFTFVEDMVSQKVMYQFVDQNNSSLKSNMVTINVSYDCPEICHVTTTGEYYLGTDFNPSDGCNENQINFSNNSCLENHFEANGIRFQGCTGGHVEKGWKETDKDRDAGVIGKNYYYVFNGGNCSNTPFFLTFDRSRYLNKTFRFTMRLYLDLSRCGSFDEQAKMNFRTSFGNPVNLCVDGEVYDGNTGEHLHDYNDCAMGTHLDHSVVLGGDIWRMARNGHRLIRMEFIFYGRFLTQNQEELRIYPEFQQWPSCAQVAVDYISGEAANVCLGRGAVCVGEDAEVNAAGFPKDAEYIWEYADDNGTWRQLYLDGFVQRGKDKQSISIHVDWVGRRKYRVRSDDGHPLDKPIEFYVTGKNCNPVQPTDIKMPADPFCVPNTRQNGTFTVDPVDANPNVHYTWKFITPRGEEFGSKYIIYTNRVDTTGVDTTSTGDRVVESSRGQTVTLIMNEKAEEGKYTVIVQPIKTMMGSDGQPYWAVAGDPLSKTFNVYRTPQVQIIKEGTDPLRQSEVELCPTDHNQKVVAIADVKESFSSQYESQYVYTWKDGAVGKTNSATVDFPALGSCDGSYKNHKVSVTVQIKNVGCPSTVEQSWKLGKIEKPTIDCSSLPALDGFVLGETEKTKSIELDFPSYTAGCETDPLLRIELNYVPKTGSNITKTFEAKKSAFDRLNRTVELPAGAGSVVYTVVDGCDNAAFCTKTIMVKDETPPNVNCDDIEKYTTRLTLQEGCDARPDYDVTLPTIVAPKLKDQNGVDGTITGVYMGRAYNPATEPSTNPPSLSLFNANIGLNDNYKVGTTYILWRFTDASGNSAYCLQPVQVIDDHVPAVTCPDANIGDVSNKPGFCGLSMNALIAQLKELPSAKGLCSDSTVVYQPVFYYRNVADDDLEEVPNARFDDIIFDVNETYEVVWRFFKNNDRSTGLYEDCARRFTVRDTEEPYFNCSSLATVRVTANSYKPQNKGYEYLSYATKADVTVPGTGPGAASITYKGTLAEAFASGDIRIIDPSEVKDNCPGDIMVEVTLVGPDENGVEKTERIRRLKDLEDHKYYVGLTTLNFRFIDANNREATCAQNIIVTAGTTPIPDCPSKTDTVVYVDNACKVNFKVLKSTVPTAQIPVNQEGLWLNLRYKVISGLHFDEECQVVAEYFPNKLTELNGVHSVTIGGGVAPGQGHTQELTIDYLCEQYMDSWDSFKDSEFNSWNAWSSEYESAGPGGPGGPGGPAGPGQNNRESILSASDQLTTVVDYTGYPFEIELIDSTGKRVVLVENPYTAADIAPERVIYSRFYGSSGNVHECHNTFHTCKYADIKTQNNFSDVVLNQTLTKGTYSLVYRFQNEKGGLQLDSCVVNITVVDTIAPLLDCGDWNKSGTFPANEECVTTVDEVPWFKKPTVADLKVKDNCSVDPNDFTITWNRRWENYNISADAALTEPFALGVTTMTWFVADASGNKSSCEQVITVEDVTGPSYDCSALIDIVVETETNCEASAKSVQAAGLDIPYALDDKCSPTGKPIPAEGTRSDGKDIFKDPYPRGTTVITWVFKDAKGNETVCTQNVIVEDRTAPVFEDCEKMPEVVIELPENECAASTEEVKAALGKQTAIDDCDGDVDGKPFVLSPDGASLLPLYDSFKKDTTYTIVWTFTDLSGNSVECSQKLTIKDVTPPNPSGVCPPPTKDVYAKTVCSVTYDELQLPTQEQMKLVDPCDGVLYPTVMARVMLPDGTSLVYFDDELKDVTYPVGTHYFYWIYQDKGGLRDTCTMALTVNDSILPILEDCDVDPVIHLTVDGDICAIDPANVETYIREPKAYDECDDYRAGTGLSWLVPVVERFFVDSTAILGAAGDTIGFRYDSTLVADGVTKKWNEDVFPKGKTTLRWIFTDASGNQVRCEKSVIVHDFTPPYFDCDEIDPDTLRPEAYKGDCEVEFGNLRRDVLDKLAYKAWDACAGDSVPGVLTLNGNEELPTDYTMSVGITYRLLWLFVDEDGNKTTCPQYIIPSHLNDVDFDCNTIKDTVAYAQEGECAITADSLRLRIPVALDSCAVLSGFGGEFEAYGIRSDGLPITDPFPTGYTQIKWMFVSPWNLHDTLWCDQKVTILGNKHFDLNCDELTPTRRDTLADCGPTDPLTFVIDTPRVADPCIVDEHDPEYWRVGVGTRSDKKPITDPFVLGNTTIQWVFTDFTGAINDTCVQDVVVRTSLDMIYDCDALGKDTIKVDVAQGECTVDASKVKDLISVPFALHPCPEESGVDTIWGVPSRRFGMSMDSSFYIGLSEIIWTFVDPSHTVLNDSVTCSQWVRVGDVNEMPVRCENFPDKVFRLHPDDCEISWQEMEIKVPGIIDLCSHEIIDPVVTRSSGKQISAVTSVVGADTIVTVTADVFSVGVDTIQWTYSFHGQLFVCDQVITVKDSMAPLYDCKNLETIVVPSIPGKCFVNSSAIFDSLPNPWPQAEDVCNQQKIDGRVFLEDGQELTKASSFRVSVGEHILTWIFIDETINEIADTCSQNLIVMGDQAPIFDCDQLKHDPILVEGCDTTLDNTYITTPYALDACTNDSVAGVGVRLDGGKLYGVYPVGTTSIRWVFVSPFSSIADTCIQDITVLTKQELDLHCTDVNGDTINVDVEEGECFTAVDLQTPYALHPCPDQSGVKKIMGIPYRSDNRAITDSFRTGVTVVTWVFTDNSGTMYKNVDTCYTVVRVGDVNKMPVDCKNMPDTTILLPPTDCEISWKEINFSVPEVRDLCSDSLITPTLTRWSGKSMDENFTVGPDTIYWNYNFFGQIVTCSQGVLVLDSVAPAFDCSTLKDTVMVATPGLCEVSAEDFKLFLGDPVAIDSCTSAEVHGRAYVCGASSSKEPAPRVVDLGLSVKWAASNLGTDKPEEYGKYYAWGETTEKSVYDWSNYKYGTEQLLSKYNATDGKMSLDIEDDAAYVNLGEGWRMPTYEEEIELMEKCDWKFMTLNNVNGYEITGPNGNSIFMPCTGYKKVIEDRLMGDTAYYWSSNLSTNPDKTLVSNIMFLNAGSYKHESYRPWGITIRPVYDSANNPSDDDCVSVDKVTAKVGETLQIHWIFQDSLLNAVAKECDQTVTVKGTAEPIFDCSSLKDTILYLELDQCELPTGKLVIDVPVAKDSCTGIDVPGVPARRDGFAMMDRYPKGVTVVDWTFTSPHSVTSKVCPQNVVVKDTFPPQFLCETLKDTLKVRITMASVSETEVSYDEVVAVGLEIPSVKDFCDGLIIAEATRSDGKDLKDNYVLGDPVEITWTFRDSSGNERICSQVVLVEDWLIEDLICPSELDGKVFTCIDDIPEPYADYAAFKAAGGEFTDEKKLLENTFRYENRYEGDSCEMVYTRTYHVEDFRHNDIYCQQVLTVRDTTAPEILVGNLHDTILTCTQEIFLPVTLSAVDNCDPNPTVSVSETNYRGTDPSSCEYFNYDILRKYVAVDRCGNESTFIQTISIRDTTGPTFTIPEGWRDSVLAKNFKACIFGVPDMTIDARKFVSDDCTEDNDITIVQHPAAGTHIDRSMRVWVYATDKCGNTDSLSRFVIVQQPATIVTLEAHDMDTCVSDKQFTLSTQNVRFAKGFILSELSSGRIRQLPSVFSYDYYRGSSVNVDNLIFSDNPYTYLRRFDALISRFGSADSAQKAMTALTKRSESGYYTFVAMDTTTGCTDTATAYINIAEKPRVRLSSAVLSECEGNLVDFNPYLNCESDMGASIISAYWTFDSVPFEFEDSIKGKMQRSYDGGSVAYVLENRCGTTSSRKSLFMLCDGDDFGKNEKADSIKFFGSVDRYELFKKDRLFVFDSILLDVHKRYMPDSILVETEPSNPVRIWRGESVTLKLKTGYDFLSTEWYRVVKRFDREFYDNLTSTYDYSFSDDSTRAELDDEEDENLFSGTADNSYIEDTPLDTSLYYVVIHDGVCPSATSSLIRVDVITRIPTAFTPFTKDGLNDFFMERHPVTIFDRYGQKVFEGLNGWDGTTSKGHRADPGVYFYEVVMIDGSIMRGTVEIVKLK